MEEKIINLSRFIEIPFNNNYLVDKQGNVYSKYIQRLIKPIVNEKGYLKVRLATGVNPKEKKCFLFTDWLHSYLYQIPIIFHK